MPDTSTGQLDFRCWQKLCTLGIFSGQRERLWNNNVDIIHISLSLSLWKAKEIFMILQDTLYQ